jgi:hypothetical protein
MAAHVQWDQLTLGSLFESKLPTYVRSRLAARPIPRTNADKRIRVGRTASGAGRDRDRLWQLKGLRQEHALKRGRGEREIPGDRNAVNKRNSPD